MTVKEDQVIDKTNLEIDIEGIKHSRLFEFH